MKSQLLKRISGLVIIALFSFNAAQAQIIYTDVKPDSVIAGLGIHQYSLDLNNDGIYDFILSTSNGRYLCGEFGRYFRRYAFVTSAVASKNAIINSGTNYALALDSLTIIGNLSHWSDTIPIGSQILFDKIDSGAFCNPYHFWGYWTTSSDKYLGLKFNTGSNTYYGWVRLSAIFSGGQITVRDYAYNSIPNQPIRAGEKSCSATTAKLNANGPLSFCAGDSVTFTAKGTGYLYQWKNNNNDISGATSQTYVAKTAGIYKCKVTNSCGSKISKRDTVTISCKGLLNIAATSNEKIISTITQLKVAPNPLSNSTTISFTLPQTQKISISIYDITGRQIKTLANAQMPAGTHQLVWNTKDEKGNAFVAGIYVLRMQAGNYAETKKLVVVK